jgi:hypothetical protein
VFVFVFPFAFAFAFPFAAWGKVAQRATVWPQYYQRMVRARTQRALLARAIGHTVFLEIPKQDHILLGVANPLEQKWSVQEGVDHY